MNKCKECFYHSDEPSTCEFYQCLMSMEHDACLHFEFKDEDDSTELDK